MNLKIILLTVSFLVVLIFGIFMVPKYLYWKSNIERYEKISSVSLNFISIDSPKGYSLIEDYIPENSSLSCDDLSSATEYWYCLAGIMFEDKDREIINETDYRQAVLIARVFMFVSDNYTKYGYGSYTNNSGNIKLFGNFNKINLGTFDAFYNYSQYEIVRNREYNKRYNFSNPERYWRKSYEYIWYYNRSEVQISCFGDLNATLQPTCEEFVRNVYNHLEQYRSYLN